MVRKSATFWLIRFANTWKFVTTGVFIKQLDLELHDALDLNFNQAPTSKAILTGTTYNPDTKKLQLTFWLPFKAGYASQYPFAWPAEAVVNFPLATDDAGGKKLDLSVVTGEPS